MNSFKIENLNLSFVDGAASRKIFENAQVEFEAGKVYAIMGRSGSGKSSFISVLSGLLKPNSANISYNGASVDYKSMTDFRRNNIGIVFQNYNLIDYLSPVQNINVATSIQIGEKLETDYINYLLDLVGISAINTRKPVVKLSGGECQRVAIARALAGDAPILLADEPTGNLDLENEKKVMGIFKKIAVESNKIIIIVTHSKDVATECDQTFVIEGCGFKNVSV